MIFLTFVLPRKRFTGLRPVLSSALFIALTATSVTSSAQVSDFASYKQSSMLTEQESVRRGLARPEITILLNATLDSAKSEILDAGRWPNPTLAYQRESTPSNAGRNIEQTYLVSQQLDLSGKRSLRRDAAQQRFSATQAEIDQRQIDLATEIRHRFYEVLYRQQLMEVTEQWVRRMLLITDTVKKLNQGGEVAGYDYRRMKLELANAESRQQAGLADYDKAWQRLAAIVGTRAEKERVTGDLFPEPPRSLEILLVQLDQRPAIHALQRRAAAFNLERKAAQRDWLPDVTVGLGRKTVEIGANRDTGTVATLSLPLPFFDHNLAGQQRATAQANIVQSEAVLLRMRLEGEVRGLWQQLQSFSLAVRHHQTQTTNATKELVRVAEAAYRGGETGILELLDAYRTTLEAENRALELSWQARQVAIELNSITGIATK